MWNDIHKTIVEDYPRTRLKVLTMTYFTWYESQVPNWMGYSLRDIHVAELIKNSHLCEGPGQSTSSDCHL